MQLLSKSHCKYKINFMVNVALIRFNYLSSPSHRHVILLCEFQLDIFLPFADYVHPNSETSEPV